MNIDPATLKAEAERALQAWPFITDVEITYGLPRAILLALGSRETNLRDVYGDHGVRNGVSGPLPGGAWAAGVWQLDAGSHTIPPGFINDVHAQAVKAASMMRALIDHFHGGLRPAFAAYNAGEGTADYNLSHGLDIDTGTAGGDYSADVLQRMVSLQRQIPEVDVITDADIERIRRAIVLTDIKDGPGAPDLLYKALLEVQTRIEIIQPLLQEALPLLRTIAANTTPKP